VTSDLEQRLAVRRARANELHHVLAVHADGGQGTPTVRRSAREAQIWDRMMGTADLHVYLAFRGRRAVGTASLTILPNVTYHTAPSAIVEAVVVVTDERRRGVATALLTTILEHTRRAGCDKVQLLSHVRHADDGGHDLYRSVGFRPEAAGFRLYHRSSDGHRQP
jgi:GNAT superfamily N-acetyltransferase